MTQATHASDRICEWVRCGASFSTTSPRKRYCTDACQRRAHKADSAVLQRVTSTLDAGHHLGRYYDALLRDPCAYCGSPSEHVDHIEPARQGGENEWTNYTAACATCNARKGNHSLLVFLVRRPLLQARAEMQATLSEWASMAPPASTAKKRTAKLGRARQRAGGGG